MSFLAEYGRPSKSMFTPCAPVAATQPTSSSRSAPRFVGLASSVPIESGSKFVTHRWTRTPYGAAIATAAAA